MSDCGSGVDVREGGTDSTSRSFKIVLLIIVLYAAAIYLPFLGSGRTLTRHEVDVTQPAMVMLDGGSWIVPMYERSEPLTRCQPIRVE